jgi:chromosome segregation ATPase
MKLRTEYDASIVMCEQYRTASLEYGERCRQMEEIQAQMTFDNHRLRSQLSLTSQVVDEQTVQIVDLEKSLIETKESLSMAKHYHMQVEEQLHEQRSIADKHRVSMQEQIDAYGKQLSQQENQLRALETANHLLKDELNTVIIDKTFLLTMIEQDKLVGNESYKRIDGYHTDSKRSENEWVRSIILDIIRIIDMFSIVCL